MQLHQVWRLRYRQRRYMEHVTDDELRQRFADMATILTTLGPDGKIECLPATASPNCPWAAFTHVCEEAALRGWDVPTTAGPDFRNRVCSPHATWPASPALLEILKGRSLAKWKFWIRYSKREYLMEMIANGKLRLAPARCRFQ